MKFSAKVINLKNAVGKVERLVSKQTTLPILSNILISTEKGRLTLASTNLEIAAKVFVGAKVEKDGQITVPARILAGFLSNIKDEVIECELEGTDLILRSTEHKLKLRGMEAADFPIIPKIPEKAFFEIDQSDFDVVISSILTSVAKNDSRLELNGVYIEFGEEDLILAATDSFRLSEAIVKYKKNSLSEDFLVFKKENPSIIIPALTLSEIQRIASSTISNQSLKFSIDQNQLFVNNNEVKIISRLINGNYPEYKQVLPKNFETEVVVERDKMINAVRISSLMAAGQGGEVKITKIKDNPNLIVSSQSIDAGENVSEIVAKVKGAQFEICFNCQYLLDGLSLGVFRSEKVIFKINQQKSPMVIRGFDEEGKEDERFSYVVMPIIKQ